jgi:hypothetical protein
MADAVSDRCFLVQDLDRAMLFYRDMAGFQLLPPGPG